MGAGTARRGGANSPKKIQLSQKKKIVTPEGREKKVMT